jgi:hypothetical protein
MNSWPRAGDPGSVYRTMRQLTRETRERRVRLTLTATLASHAVALLALLGPVGVVGGLTPVGVVVLANWWMRGGTRRLARVRTREVR